MTASDLRLLRRTDWRLLLPSPVGGAFSHLLLLGGPPGLAERILEMGLAHDVHTEPAGTVEAIAVLRGAPVSLPEAARSLAPGGAFYGETDDPRGARQALEGEGLSVTGTYALWPSFEETQACVPLAAPRALRWFAESLYPAWTMRKKLIRASLPLLGRSPERGAGLVTRCFALTAVKPPAGNPLPALIGDGSLPLVVSHGAERAILLPFPRTGKEPLRVLKVPRLPAFSSKTIAEQEVLTRLQARLDGPARAALPVPGGLLSWNGMAVGIESLATGRSFVHLGDAWRRPSRRLLGDLRLAASWLTEFHRQTERSRSPWTAGDVARHVEQPFEELRRRLGATEREERLFAAARRRAESLVGVALPIVWQHRDFTPWNLLRGKGGEIRVLDWEGARPGLPLCDLLHFVTHWHELARRALEPKSRHRAFRELWTGLPGGLASSAALDAVALYCARLRIDLKFLPLLLALTWLEIALRPSVPGGEPRPDSPGRAYLDILAGHADRLFESPHGR